MHNHNNNTFSYTSAHNPASPTPHAGIIPTHLPIIQSCQRCVAMILTCGVGQAGLWADV